MDIITYLCYYAFMRTTFELPDQLFRKAKAAAALQGISLKDLFSQAITEKLKRISTPDKEKPWMAFYEKGGDYARELDKVENFIAAEFETIRDEDWK